MVSTMRKTRRANVLHAEKSEGRRKVRALISLVIRTERISITKAIVAKKSSTQDSIG